MINIITLKVYYDSVEGSKLVHIYGINSYPFIAILDPRTGEKLIQYQSNKFDACSFCEKITNFLCENEPDFKQNTESDDIIEILETKNEKEVVVIDEKTETNNGHDVNYILLIMYYFIFLVNFFIYSPKRM